MFFGVINRKILARKPNESEMMPSSFSFTFVGKDHPARMLSVFQVFIIFNPWKSAYDPQDPDRKRTLK
ncbi:hypothetical protein HR09_06850 [Porphyromonas gulae]|nr:hypothetical protein HR09_06850 [Porphyromonas gulae]